MKTFADLGKAELDRIEDLAKRTLAVDDFTACYDENGWFVVLKNLGFKR